MSALDEDDLQSKAVELCERLWSMGHRADDIAKWTFIADVAPMLCDELRAMHSAGYDEGHADAESHHSRNK